MPCVAAGEAGRYLWPTEPLFQQKALQTVHYVYMIKSDAHPMQTYVGYSADLKKRLRYHNEGDSPHTAKYKPWSLAFYAAFPTKTKALEFETYLKSHSGKAFAAKRLT